MDLHAMWNSLPRGVFQGSSDLFLMNLAVITHTFRPDGKELAVATLDGQISFWDVLNSVQTGAIEGRNDMHVGRRVTDKVTAKKLAGATWVMGGLY
jgi:periodic tryptophan protein 2